MKHAQAMPTNLDQPETRGEAQADRHTLLGAMVDLPSQFEKKSMKWFIIALGMLVFVMAGGAVYYFQMQLKMMQTENLALRDRLTDYLVTANITTVSALDRNTAALREETQTNRDVKEVLNRILAKPQ